METHVIIEEAVELSWGDGENGLLPEKAAEQVLQNWWSRLSDQQRYDLALTGLGRVVADRVKRRRNQPPIEQRREQAERRKQRAAEVIAAGGEEAYERLQEEKYQALWKNVETAIDRCVDKKIVERLDAIRLVGADETMRSLLRFTTEDVKYWVRYSKTHAKSWALRKAWFEDAAVALRKNKASAIFELPGKTLNQLGKRAQEIWEKESDGGRQRRAH